jgi:hypothetical protein
MSQFTAIRIGLAVTLILIAAVVLLASSGGGEDSSNEPIAFDDPLVTLYHKRRASFHVDLLQFNTTLYGPIAGKPQTTFGNFSETFLDARRSYLSFVPLHVPSLRKKNGNALMVIFPDKFSTSWVSALYQSSWLKRTISSDLIAVFMQSNGREPQHMMKSNGTWTVRRNVNESSLVDDITYTSVVLDRLLTADFDGLIDEQQIYFVGYGEGGSFALRAAAELSTTVAAVAMIGGGFSRSLCPPFSSLKRVPPPPLFIATSDGDTAHRAQAYEARGWHELLPMIHSCE